MTFIKKTKTERTCKDFKPSFWDKNGCKLTHLCADAKNHWKELGRCIGIKPHELYSPKGIQNGVQNKSGEKPKTKRTKPLMRDSIKKRR